MRYPFFVYFSAAGAYRSLLQSLLANPVIHEVRGESMFSEIMSASVLIESAETLDISIPERKQNEAYKYCEALWDMSGTCEVSILETFQHNITRFVADQEDKSKAVWGYGEVVAHALPIIVRELEKDLYSRRAVFVMPRTPYLQGTPPCLVSMQFLVRDSRVHGIVNMRSNDAWLGFPLDVFQFGLMLHSVAGYFDLQVGSYQHNAASLHLYARDVDRARAVVDSIPRTDNEWTMIPSIGKDAIHQIAHGKLLDDLRSVCSGKSASPASAFHSYLRVMETAFRERVQS